MPSYRFLVNADDTKATFIPFDPRSHLEEFAGGSTYESKAKPAQKRAKSRSNLGWLNFCGPLAFSSGSFSKDDEAAKRHDFLLSAGKGKKKAVPVEQMQDDTAIVIQNRIILSVIQCGRGMVLFLVMKSLSFFDCQKEKGTNEAVIQLLNEPIYLIFMDESIDECQVEKNELMCWFVTFHQGC